MPQMDQLSSPLSAHNSLLTLFPRWLNKSILNNPSAFSVSISQFKFYGGSSYLPPTSSLSWPICLCLSSTRPYILSLLGNICDKSQEGSSPWNMRFYLPDLTHVQLSKESIGVWFEYTLRPPAQKVMCLGILDRKRSDLILLPIS